MGDRSDLIVESFRYLIDDYGFGIVRKEFDVQAMGNAVVIFQSAKFGIEIVVDRSQVSLSIGDKFVPRAEWFEFSDVIKYYAPDVEHVYAPVEKPENGTWDDSIKLQASRLAEILRHYCASLLMGESWEKDKIKDNEIHRVAKMFGRFG